MSASDHSPGSIYQWVADGTFTILGYIAGAITATWIIRGLLDRVLTNIKTQREKIEELEAEQKKLRADVQYLMTHNYIEQRQRNIGRVEGDRRHPPEQNL